MQLNLIRKFILAIDSASGIGLIAILFLGLFKQLPSYGYFHELFTSVAYTPKIGLIYDLIGAMKSIGFEINEKSWPIYLHTSSLACGLILSFLSIALLINPKNAEFPIGKNNLRFHYYFYPSIGITAIDEIMFYSPGNGLIGLITTSMYIAALIYAAYPLLHKIALQTEKSMASKSNSSCESGNQK